MSQNPIVLPTTDVVLGGAAMAAKINQALDTLATNFAGPAAPDISFPHMAWLDTAGPAAQPPTPALLKMRTADNAAWVVLGSLSDANWIPYISGGALQNPTAMTGAINEAKAAPVSSAAAPNIWSGAGNLLHITGTTAITGFAAAPQAGARRRLVFDDAVTLVSGANLIVPGGTNYTTAAGDIVDVTADTPTQFRLAIVRANGAAVVAPASAIRQVHTVQDTTARSTSSTSYADTGITGIVLPQALASAASKVRIRVSGVFSTSSPGGGWGEFTLNDGAADLHGAPATALQAVSCYNGGGNSQVMLTPFSFEFVHTPGAVAPKTYALRWRSTSGTLYIGRRGADSLYFVPTAIAIEEIV